MLSKCQFINCIILIFLCITSTLSFANHYNIAQLLLSNATLVGEARMTYVLWDVYDDKLHATNNIWKASEPFALELKYLRKLKGGAIARRSIKEIQDQGFKNQKKLDIWLVKMENIFPDVDDTSTLIGLVDDNQHTTFYFNGSIIGNVADPEFTEQFFNIWLGAKTSEPKLREKLLGISKGN